jgi:hypothetical protein
VHNASLTILYISLVGPNAVKIESIVIVMIEAIKVNQPNFLSFENIFRFHTSMIEPSLGKGEEQRY